MNQRASMELFFQSPLFSTIQANPEQLKQYALVFWPIQVNFIVGLPALTSTVCERIGKLALEGSNTAEEKRLKAILRHMFPPTVDELGHGCDQPQCMHHDLFAAQVQACTGLAQKTLREDWIRGTANQRLANTIRESVRSVSDGLHMMYVVESLAPRFFVHQEALFLSCSDPRKVIHSTMHKTTELEHADDAEKFMKYVDMDENLIDTHFMLWRDVADQMHSAMRASALC
ncbi:hypothetical protein BX592_13620 [Paraburkholderia rhizosphaerae]|uniref:Pyrroloquinoline-quinone synthase n=2 Tax=Paraburkholderia rhizosphaerae TaxID=480658 RepID=A0A4R8L745_9BURK|nr:hypothetical protein BX592_13620 [Paraburkholderia rhizosphaerae]